MSDRVLVAVLNGRAVGQFTMDRHGRLRFEYEDSWRSFDGAFPLSLSMPLASRTHRHATVEPFVSGLLPDRDEILDSWARRFQASRNPFSLLMHVGEDCPGAFQFLRPERLPELETTGVRGIDVDWLAEDDVAERIRMLRRDPTAWRAPGDAGQFSLGGAQAKTSLLFQDGRWGVPFGRTPTTHILKPPIPGFDGHVENEHLCLQLARALGLPVASSEVRRFGDETAIVVERYDRARTADLAASAAAESARWAADAAAAAAQGPESAGAPARAAEVAAKAAEASARAQGLASLAEITPILRLHQEDICQALAVPPRNKYQSEGGPSARDIVDLLRIHSSRPELDVWTFVDALAFNWIVGGTDAHAKNYSVLHGGGGQVRLAPFYDMASILPYDDFASSNLKLSMKVGGSYKMYEIDGSSWRRCAGELRLQSDDMVSRLRAMALILPERLDALVVAARAGGLDHPIIERLAASLPKRARDCARTLE